jgi:LuxR family maltose regulon positive regulatory protein
LPVSEEVEVGSDRWYGWLADPATKSFSFQGNRGTLTARKERRSRGGGYWVAYRKRGGRLRKVYLGKAEELTLTRLEDTAETLAKDDEDRAGPGAQAHSSEGGVVSLKGVEDPAVNAHEPPDTSFLQTKLSVPAVRGALVPRPGLAGRLDGALSAKLTLVSAPAGFGKTTLLAAWVESLPDGGKPNVAWLSLDAADNDPVRFWSYFAATVGQISPGAEKYVLTMVRSPQAPPIEAILMVLINALAVLSGYAVLVLDDYHAIESPEIHRALSFFVEQLPSHVHLIIATRADPSLPLARMRARGELIELRAAALRFTLQETGKFLDRIMDLPLPAEENAKPHERTEGWIAGLQLAAHAMRGLENTAAFVEGFTGSNRYVIDYLAEEVLGRQSGVLRIFLLRTCVLEQMCGPLCDVVVGPQEVKTPTRRSEAKRRWSISSRPTCL